MPQAIAAVKFSPSAGDGISIFQREPVNARVVLYQKNRAEETNRRVMERASEIEGILLNLASEFGKQ